MLYVVATVSKSISKVAGCQHRDAFSSNLATMSFYCCGNLGERADLRQPPADVRIHPARRVPVRYNGEMGSARCRLLLLHHAVDDRVRRLRAGHQPRLVAFREERRVWSVPRVWPGAHRHVFQPDAGGSTQQVSTSWTSSWSYQLTSRHEY